MSVSHRSIRLDSSVQSTSTSGTGPQRSYAKLPAYLHRRGSCFYFKRKIPADVLRAFPGERSQVWKSLDTHLLEKARVMLAVEVSEFDFRVAKYRRECAAKLAGLAPEAVVKRASSGLFAALMAEPTAEELARIALVRTLVPQSAVQVPASRQTDWLLRHLPLPEVMPVPGTEAVPPHARVRLRDTWQR